MNIQQLIKGMLVGIVILGLSLNQVSWADDKSKKHNTQVSDSVKTDVKSKDVKSKSEDEISKKRKALVKEALTALSETKKALKALEDNKPQEALKSLAAATGELEIIMSRDPELALVPVDVEIASFDLYADIETIEEAKEQAEKFLDEGEVQKARALLSNLASELVATTISLPLATYPDAVKAVVPLIDEGKIEEAKSALHAALNTLVITNKMVLPFPILRADALIAKAEELAKTLETPVIKNESGSGASASQGKSANKKSPKEQVLNYLQKARQQLKMAEALGYGLDDENRYKDLKASIEAIEKKIHINESSQGVFQKLKQSLVQFKKNLLED